MERCELYNLSTHIRKKMRGRITLLYDCFSCDVCDREHGIKYVTGEKKETFINKSDVPLI